MNTKDFPMLNNDIIYFDNGATSLKPKCVLDKMSDYYENYSANAHRGDYSISYKVDLAYEDARVKVAKFINADPEECQMAVCKAIPNVVVHVADKGLEVQF